MKEFYAIWMSSEIIILTLFFIFKFKTIKDVENNKRIQMGVLTWIAVTILGVIGFAVTGPVAGSLAAIIQSTVYGGAVASGSVFATLQSIAMAAPTP